MNIPEELKYTADHEWILVDGNIAKIGITDFAQGELGDVVYVDIDPAIDELVKGDPFGTIEAVKTVSDLYGPLSGKVTEVNNLLADNPEKINTDPYGEGWMIKIEIADHSEIPDLLDNASYKELIGQ
ncbi:MAG: glycine cleavage system protein GcvH [Ignavibacteria bacterium]|nr:glycine cleavage system protein GcvH [Ignavibacteria bacterium]MBT8386818.1 glycine cleavage system protein GcvH [Ignavibacteria bacterium]